MRSILPPIKELPDINTPPFERDNDSLNTSFFMTKNILDLCTGCLGIFSQNGFAMYAVGKYQYCYHCSILKVTDQLLQIFRVWALCGKDVTR